MVQVFFFDGKGNNSFSILQVFCKKNSTFGLKFSNNPSSQVFREALVTKLQGPLQFSFLSCEFFKNCYWP